MFRWSRFRFSTSSACRAFRDNVDQGLRIKTVPKKAPEPPKLTRQEKISRVNMASHTKLYYINQKYNIFNKTVRRVLDLGCVPGNWTQFAKNKLCEIHQLSDEEFNKKCHILGVDILFANPPTKTSAIQGNIFSRQTHDSIHDYFKEIVLRERSSKNESYIDKEHEDIDQLASGINKLMIKDVEPQDYQPDLVLSDLSTPFMQNNGFFNNTQTRPYIRLATNEGLKATLSDPSKSAIDLADASLLLTCTILKKNGTLVLRLGRVKLDDPELKLLQSRLQKVFKKVIRWDNPETETYTHQGNPNLKIDEVVFVCLNKKSAIVDKFKVFLPKT